MISLSHGTECNSRDCYFSFQSTRGAISLGSYLLRPTKEGLDDCIENPYVEVSIPFVCKPAAPLSFMANVHVYVHVY